MKITPFWGDSLCLLLCKMAYHHHYVSFFRYGSLLLVWALASMD